MLGVLAVVLAGGRGSRLEPLTRDRSKPAVPFGGCFRIIDFSLSNCVNSGIRRILVVTQYKSASLERHIELGWHFLPSQLGEFVSVRPPEQRLDENWYQGTADAIYQNIYTIEKVRPAQLLILSGDHIYRMDYAKFINAHRQSGADATIACMPVPLAEGRRFGVVSADASSRIRGFAEKPDNPQPLPDRPDQCLASMGIYVFNTEFLFEQLCEDANHPGSQRDFGRDVIPSIIDSANVMAWHFTDASGQPGYWQDVGTIDSYYEASINLTAVTPHLNLYDPAWPFRTSQQPLAPPKFVFNDTASNPPRVGSAVDSLVCPGSIIAGGSVERSVLSPRVRINSCASVRGSILFDGVNIGQNSIVQNAIIDKDVVVPDFINVGTENSLDRARGLTVTESGVVVVPRGFRFT
jgi:glucose-1-phosphate adenylyltransferase